MAAATNPASDTARSPLELVATLVGAIETGDLDLVRSLYAPGAVAWTCFDNLERDTDGSLAVLHWFVGSTTERRYEITRRIEIDGGVLQQHVLHATAKSGKTFAAPACIVVLIEDGQITRIDEYLDAKPVIGALE